MKFNCDTFTNDPSPWDLTLTIGGKDWVVRALTVGDINAIRRLGQLPRDQQYALIANLFSGEEKPDVAAWSATQAERVLGGIFGYLKARAEKNFLAIVDEAASAAATIAR